MRRKAAWISGTAVLGILLVTNPVFAQAASLITGADIANGTVTTADVKNHNLKLKDFAPSAKTGLKGATGATGATGAQGVQGVQGVPGPTGPQGIVTLGSVVGATPAIPANGGAFAFIGPTVTLTTNDTQSLVGTSSSALGTTSGTASIGVYLCYQPTGGTVTQFGNNSGNYLYITVDTTRQTFAVSAATTPGAGTYTVGACADNFSGTAVDFNDYTSGTYQVINTPTGLITAAGVKGAQSLHINSH